jgi:HK97 family phage portal protein
MRLFGYEITKNRKNKNSKSIFGMNNAQMELFWGQGRGTVGVEVYKKIWIASKCVSLISENVAGLPFYITDSEGNRVDENIFGKFITNPNNLTDTGQDIIRDVIAYYLLDGNGYIYINKGLTNDYYALISQKCTPKTNKTLFGGIAYYNYTEEENTKKFLPEEIIHFKAFNPYNRYVGLPKLTGASKETDFLDLVNNYKTNLYDNQATPSGAFETDDVLNEEQFERLRQQLEKDYSGAKNAGKPMLFEAGLKYKQYSFNPSDLNLIESELITAGNIATMYGVPVELLGAISDNKTYSNYKEARASFYVETVLPTAGKLIETLNKYLYPNSDYKIKINKSEIPELKPTAGDLEKTWWISPNMKRALQGYTKIDDEAMNKIYIPANYIDINDLGDISIKDEL